MSATNRGSKRSPNDFYATPPSTVKSILPFINWLRVDSFIEPCRGGGAILNEVPAHVGSVRWAEITDGVDYLTTDLGVADIILTNPPFSVSEQFLEKSLKEAHCVVYLQRLNWLGAQKRREWWQDKLPTHLFVLSDRPKFVNNRTDATEYAWFCWDRREIINAPKGIYVI